MSTDEKLKPLIICLAGLVSASCIHHPNLPVAWAPSNMPVGNACPDISGTYKIVFDCEDFSKIRNASSFLGKRPGDTITHISIRQPDQDLIHVSALEDGKVIFSNNLSLKAGDFLCEDGWIKINSFNPTIAHGTMVVGLSLESQTDSYTRSGGYLLVKSSDSGIGFALVPSAGFVPFVFSVSKWCRSPEQSESESSEDTNPSWQQLQMPEDESRQPQVEAVPERRQGVGDSCGSSLECEENLFCYRFTGTCQKRY